MNKNIFVLHHFDLDGRGAAAIIRLLLKGKDAPDKENYIEISDYSEPLPLERIGKNDYVYIVDYCFSEKTIEQLRALRDITKNIVWIDHHKPSIELDEKYPEFKLIPGIRKVGICGAALTYMYINHIDKLEDVPYFIRLIDDYDCWKLKIEESAYFKLGMEVEGFEPFDEVWDRLFSTDIHGQTKDSVYYIIDKGRSIKSYIDNQNAFHLNNAGYETEIDGLKCLAINRSSNSWIFGDRINDYPIVMVYYFNGKRFVHSIFTVDPNVDCCAIATKFGGGGHQGAAGFQLNELRFKPIKEEVEL